MSFESEPYSKRLYIEGLYQGTFLSDIYDHNRQVGQLGRQAANRAVYGLSGDPGQMDNTTMDEMYAQRREIIIGAQKRIVYGFRTRTSPNQELFIAYADLLRNIAEATTIMNARQQENSRIDRLENLTAIDVGDPIIYFTPEKDVPHPAVAGRKATFSYNQLLGDSFRSIVHLNVFRRGMTHELTQFEPEAARILIGSGAINRYLSTLDTSNNEDYMRHKLIAEGFRGYVFTQSNEITGNLNL